MTPTPDDASQADRLFSLRGKTAVVTGGSSGIGKMIAAAYVGAGVKVYIASRKAEVCEQVAAELSAAGECIALPADLSSDDGAEQLAAAVGARETSLDILVNNAGATWGAELADHDQRSWDRVIGLNVEGLFHTTKRLLPLLQAAGTKDEPARIINVGSIDGIGLPVLTTYSYGASKAAVHHLTRHLARDLAPSITVNAIAPGPFPSRMMAATLAEHGDLVAESAPLKRIGRPDDMAGVAIFLASRAGSYLTGSVIPVDGGISTTR
jgi:NAD(P)-dependent dehydrogenase (short-subunit alcohol dehydrogenase family)